MVVCPQCSIEYGVGEEFCRKCGSFLLTEVEPVLGEEKSKAILTCPKCQALYKKGNYCKRCGSLLVRGTPFQEPTVQRLGKKLIKRWSKERMRLFDQKKELELCLSKLEKERDRISGDVFNPVLLRYQDQLKEVSSLHQDTEAEIESVKRTASEEIDSLEKELKHLQKRLEEFQSLYHLCAITKADFIREKSETRKEIKSKERRLKRNRQILSLLAGKMGGSIISSKLARKFLRPLTLLTVSVIIVVMGAGGYFLWGWHSQPDEGISKKNATDPPAPLPSHTAIEDQEVENVRSLFENIRQANLRKDISLFMSCYSRDFKGREGKRVDTLGTWKQVNYLDLSYDLKKYAISGNSANVKLQWLIRIIPKVGGPPQDSRIILEITLKREDGRWKIREIKAAG